MADGVNSIHIIGRVGQDPEVRQTASGTKVVNLSVATKNRDETAWHRCVLFGKLADVADQYIRQGDLIYVSGRMDYRKWTDKNSQERVSAEIFTYGLQMLGSKDRGSEGNSRSPRPPSDYPEDGDLPF